FLTLDKERIINIVYTRSKPLIIQHLLPKSFILCLHKLLMANRSPVQKRHLQFAPFSSLHIELKSSSANFSSTIFFSCWLCQSLTKNSPFSNTILTAPVVLRFRFARTCNKTLFVEMIFLS